MNCIVLNEFYCIEWIVLNWINPIELNESYWIEWIVLNWMNDELYWIWTVLNDLYWMSHYVSIVLNRIEVYQSVSNSIVQTRYISRSPDMFDDACEDPSRYFWVSIALSTVLEKRFFKGGGQTF